MEMRSYFVFHMVLTNESENFGVGGRLKYRLEVADVRTQIRTALTTLRMINDERRGAVSR